MITLDCATAGDIYKAAELAAIETRQMNDETVPLYSGLSSWLDVRALLVVPHETYHRVVITDVDNDSIWLRNKPKWKVLGIVIEKPIVIRVFTTRKSLSNREVDKWSKIITNLGRLPSYVKLVFDYDDNLGELPF